MKSYFETVKVNPNPKAKRKTVKVLIEGNWDGNKFIGYDENGFEIIVRKKEWIILIKRNDKKTYKLPKNRTIQKCYI